ncbi:cobalamin biosynthesis protein CobD [Pseudodesulfovibrio mercurii]|uniref:Cobalamin biosynthesis protein CobD n=1 Tax=Pseudodesulfovibrio mercurii TaxID=641491 RepID=F0JFP4_9BACT|nr:adenosylcobinamide-phosphate synthase CbiB [Pseudodesulfovibrio mercurii]EGB13722.1 cobalamin biosynthesis protein CobD [Pseudodesulfovibrio mercurii]
MEHPVAVFLVPALALVLDAWFGDPAGWPHPVRLIGSGLDLYEAAARRLGVNLRLAGWLAVPLFAATAWCLVGWLTAIPYLGPLLAVYFAFAGLALGCLLREARRVAELLDAGDLAGARNALSMLVSRETGGLDAEGVRRSLAETVSENLNDGFTAPLFYLALFGPAGLWAYKTVSTMDSMWGYRTDRFVRLGQGAARTDDLLAWIPARLTALFLFAAGRRLGLKTATARARFRADALKMESPNAGWPMAAAAWLLEGRMGGPTVYFGKIKDKPVLGPVGTVWDRARLHRLFRLVRKSGNLAAWTLIPVLGLIRLLFA